MAAYFEQERKRNDPFKTMYNPKPKNSMLMKSNSVSRLSSKNESKNIRPQILKNPIEQPLSSRVELIQKKQDYFLNELLPKIKTERSIKAEKWRMKKHREPGQTLVKVSI